MRVVPGSGRWKINGRDLATYFPNKVHQQIVTEPSGSLGLDGQYDVVARLHGGGVGGQAGALRLGIARALLEIDEDDYRPDLKKAGFLTRDPRVVERRSTDSRRHARHPSTASADLPSAWAYCSAPMGCGVGQPRCHCGAGAGLVPCQRLTSCPKSVPGARRLSAVTRAPVASSCKRRCPRAWPAQVWTSSTSVSCPHPRSRI